MNFILIFFYFCIVLQIKFKLPMTKQSLIVRFHYFILFKYLTDKCL